MITHEACSASGQAAADTEEVRIRKAAKILEVLHDFLGADLADRTCLDIGCSVGIISSQVATHFKATVGVDVDEAALKQARGRHQTGAVFARASGLALPVSDRVFDVVICAQVYEHVTSREALAAEIWRALRPGGVCFFSGPNRLAVMEEHYWLPFLSWLPNPLADLYMRLMRRGKKYDIAPLTYWGLRQLWRSFHLHDYAIHLLREPARFSVDDRLGAMRWISSTPEWLLRLPAPFLPNFNWILVKPA